MQEPPAAPPDTVSFPNTGHGTGAGKKMKATQLHTGMCAIPEVGVTGPIRSSRLVQEGLRPCTLQATPSSQRSLYIKVGRRCTGVQPFSPQLNFSILKILIKKIYVCGCICVYMFMYMYVCMYICM